MRKTLAYIFIVLALVCGSFIPFATLPVHAQYNGDLQQPNDNPDSESGFEESAANSGGLSGEGSNSVTESTDTKKSQESSGFLAFLNPFSWAPRIMIYIGNIILSLFGAILGIVAFLFNKVVFVTIINLKDTLDGLNIIDDIWKIIRDFINMFFIFMVLYVAINTILGREDMGGWKKTLTNLLIAAVFMNFSLFMTKVVIDASNIVTLGFYSQLPNVGNMLDDTEGKTGISNSILQSLKLETIYNPDFAKVTDLNSLEKVASGYLKSQADQVLFMIITVMGSIFILITCFILFAGACMFAMRFVKIIILMIQSPLAFAGYVLPRFEPLAKDWWKDLTNQAIWPPLYMAMMWISFRVLNSDGFKQLGEGLTTTASQPGFSDLFNNITGSTINIVFNFIIVIIFMTYSLVAAKEGGNKMAEGFSKQLNSMGTSARKAVQGYVGRNTIGRAAKAVDDKIKDNKFMNENRYGLLGSDVSLRDLTTKAAVKSKFGSDTSFDDKEKKGKEIERRETIKTDLKTALSSAGAVSTPAASANIAAALKKMSTKEVVENVKASDIIDKPDVLSNMTDEQFEAIEKDTSGKWSEEDKVKVKQARMGGLTTAMAAAAAPGGSPAAIRTAVANMSDKQKGLIDQATLTDPTFIGAIDSGSFASIMKNGSISGTVRNQMKAARYDGLNRATDPAAAKIELGKFSNDEISRIDGAIISKPEVVGALTPKMLEKLADHLDAGHISTIGGIIRTAPAASMVGGAVTPEMAAARTWIASTPANPYV